MAGVKIVSGQMITLNKKLVSREDVFHLSIMSALLLLIHFYMISRLTGPVVYADEIGYLGNAGFFSGTRPMPNMITATFYHFGYSLFIVPLFWIFDDPHYIYRGALVISAFLITSVLPLTYFFTRRILNFSSINAKLIGLVTAVYPSFFMLSKLSGAEGAFSPAFIMCVISLYFLAEKKNLLWTLLFSFFLSFLYTIHPRALAMLPVGLFVYCILVATKKISARNFFIGCVVVVALFFVTRSVNNIIQEAGYDYEGGGNEKHIVVLIKTLLSPKEISNFILEITGQIWYLTIATYGFLLIGIYKIAELIIKKDSSVSFSHRIMFLFIFLCFFGVVFGGSASFRTDFGRIDHLLYGRYNEGVIALVLLMGLTALVKDKSSYRKKNSPLFFIVPALIVIMGLIFYKGRGEAAFKLPLLHLDANCLFPWSLLFGRMDVGWISAITAGVFSVTYFCRNKKFPLALIIIFCFFSMNIYYSFVDYKENLNESGRRMRRISKVVGAIVGDNDISYDMSHYKSYIFFGLQYWLPEAEYQPFKSSRNEKPGNEYVISNNDYLDTKTADAVKIPLSKKQSLWVLGKANDDLVIPLMFPKKYPAYKLPSLTGKRDGDNRIAIEGETASGYLVCGPYDDLAPGRYRIKLKYKTDKNYDEPVGKWDLILKEKGVRRTVASDALNSNAEKGRVKYVFEVPKESGTSMFEFRVYYNGKGNLSIEELSVSSVE